MVEKSLMELSLFQKTQTNLSEQCKKHHTSQMPVKFTQTAENPYKVVHEGPVNHASFHTSPDEENKEPSRAWLHNLHMHTVC